MNDTRLPDESYEQYKDRLRQLKKAFKERLRGKSMVFGEHGNRKLKRRKHNA